MQAAGDNFNQWVELVRRTSRCRQQAGEAFEGAGHGDEQALGGVAAQCFKVV
jgi:hypothetical protein